MLLYLFFIQAELCKEVQGGMTEVLSLTTDVESLSFEFCFWFFLVFLAKSQYERTNQHSLKYFKPSEIIFKCSMKKVGLH